MKTDNQTPLRRQAGAVNRQAVIAGGAAVLFVLIAVFLFYPRTDGPPEPEPGEAPVATDVERGDTAREAIAELQASDTPNYDQAVEQAQAFRGDGRLADAQLMYFFAARAGHPQAAFELATMHDPNHFSAESNLMDEPDPFQAYKWYMQASEGGVEEAEQRLAALREWTEQQAREGNQNAEQLLVQWE